MGKDEFVVLLAPGGQILFAHVKLLEGIPYSALFRPAGSETAVSSIDSAFRAGFDHPRSAPHRFDDDFYLEIEEAHGVEVAKTRAAAVSHLIVIVSLVSCPGQVGSREWS